MVDIYQMHNKTGVSLRTLKKLDKHGYLKIDEPLNGRIENVKSL